MNTATKDRLSKQAAKLVNEGQAVLVTQFLNGVYHFVNAQTFNKWRTSCHHFANVLGPKAKIWVDTFAKSDDHYFSVAQSLLGSMESLKEAIDADLLYRIEDLVTADAFADLLEQADELHKKGFVLAAGVLGRAVLEEHLRKLCDRHGCLPAGRPTINDLNASLYKATHLDKLTMQQVTAMSTAGNHCAHNNHPPLSDTDVRKLLDDVREFLVGHPLP